MVHTSVVGGWWRGQGRAGGVVPVGVARPAATVAAQPVPDGKVPCCGGGSRGIRAPAGGVPVARGQRG